MNVQEFAALKVGDKIENPAFALSGIGEVIEVAQMGVRVRWGSTGNPMFYSVQGTIWFHWTKVTDEGPRDDA